MPPPTTKLDRIFLIINRTISLIILLALILAVGTAATMLLPSKPTQQPGEQRVAARTESPDKTVTLGFGSAEAIDGTGTEMLRLTASTGANYSSHAGETRNVLFVGATDQPARWLFKDHGNAILRLDQLRETTGPREPATTRALYIEFRKQAGKDAPTLAVALAKPDGSTVTTVLRDVTRVLSYRRIDAKRIAILFQRGTTLFQADIALEGFAVLRQRQVAQVPSAL
ncbi:hypothetical protein [Massilia sp. YMA4]|uniref:hypothetical protein n=1 Tax=Massilia sp. YMA4 TaxID=1593482 RepID=UPI000DD186FA|nr:hypothetical protein [Massilia sp. YMA4]AXA91674.1 hypothetical protein DPH57_11245 [Massilia sp. YMA4]